MTIPALAASPVPRWPGCCAPSNDHGVLVHFGKRVTAADIGQDGTVTATFGDGTRATGDLLIGADGIHSPVRTLIDPAAPAPRDTGLTIACGYADIRPPAPAGSSKGYSMFYGSRAFFGCAVGPDERTWWFARIPGLRPRTAVHRTPTASPPRSTATAPPRRGSSAPLPAR